MKILKHIIKVNFLKYKCIFFSFGETHLFPNNHRSVLWNYQNTSIDLKNISGYSHIIAYSNFSSNVVKFYNTDQIQDTFSSWSILIANPDE